MKPSSSLRWVWPSSAPACLLLFFYSSIIFLTCCRNYFLFFLSPYYSVLIICRSLFVTLQCVLGLTISGQGDKGTGSEGILTFSLNLYCQTSLLAYNHYQLEYKQWDNILFSWNNEIKKLIQYFIFGPILSSLKSSYIKVSPQYCSVMIPKTCLQLSPCHKVKNWIGKLTLRGLGFPRIFIELWLLQTFVYLCKRLCKVKIFQSWFRISFNYKIIGNIWKS